MAAAKLLLLYAIGRPTEAVDPDTLDAQEWRLFQQSQATPEQLTAAMGGMPLELACHVVRAARGPLADAKAQMLAQALAQEQTPPEEATQEEVVTPGAAERALAAERVRRGPDRRGASNPPRTGAGAGANRVADEAANPDAPDDLPDADPLARVLGRDPAVGEELTLESAEEFLRNLLRNGGRQRVSEPEAAG
jgi:hypothetical protein